MKSAIKNRHYGSDFDEFLREEGIFEEVQAAALKKVIAHSLERSMKERGLTKTVLAERLGTSRAAVNRLLDERNTSVTLHTLARTASVVGYKLKVQLVPV